MPFPARLPIPAEVLKIAQKLHGAGFDVWCIGGAVRDNLLELENKDFDLATSARPDEVQRLFKRTVPVGVEHGTVGVLDWRNRPHEVTTFRRDVTTDGRHAQVAFGVSLDDDLARRDFTINAIAYQPLTHEWRDPFAGAKDLAARRLRAVGEPGARFREDYLRILRLLRFAARFGFEIDPATWNAAKASVGGLKGLSAERVRAEWFRGLETARRASQLVALWRDMGAMERWLPELGSGMRVADGEAGPPAGSAAGAPPTSRSPLTAVDALPPDPVLITGYLSADPVATLTRLKCSNAEVERGRRIAQYRAGWPDAASDVAVRKWLARMASAADDLLLIAGAEGWGYPLIEAAGRVGRSHAPLALADLAVTGRDLLELGVPHGPQVGEILRQLLDAVLEEPALNTKEGLLDRARALVKPSARGET